MEKLCCNSKTFYYALLQDYNKQYVLKIIKMGEICILTMPKF